MPLNLRIPVRYFLQQYAFTTETIEMHIITQFPKLSGIRFKTDPRSLFNGKLSSLWWHAWLTYLQGQKHIHAAHLFPVYLVFVCVVFFPKYTVEISARFL